jgi:hypothetical protein
MTASKRTARTARMTNNTLSEPITPAFHAPRATNSVSRETGALGVADFVSDVVLIALATAAKSGA